MASESKATATPIVDETFAPGADATSFSRGLSWCDPSPRGPPAAGITRSSSGLTVTMERGTDFWRKTYYTPTLIKDDGCILGTDITLLPDCCVETEFTLDAHAQFDQAGLAVRVDAENWIKCGIEYVDGEGRASVVVTNEYSDWSTQPWTSKGEAHSMGVRVSRVDGCAFVVEIRRPGTSEWVFCRICQLNALRGTDKADTLGRTTRCVAGAFFCAPTEAKAGEPLPDAKVTFRHLKVTPGRVFDHAY